MESLVSIGRKERLHKCSNLGRAGNQTLFLVPAMLTIKRLPSVIVYSTGQYLHAIIESSEKCGRKDEESEQPCGKLLLRYVLK